MTDADNRLKEAATSAKEAFAQLKDELQLKAGLAKLDAKSAWGEVQDRIALFERSLDVISKQGEATLEKVRYDATLAKAELKANWPGLHTLLTELGEDLKTAAGEVKTEADLARVKAHLASKDAKDGADELLKKAKDQLETATGAAEAELETALSDLKETIKELQQRIKKG
jgi:hypothetical protein